MKRLAIVVVAMLALAVPAAFAAGSVTILGKTGVYIAKGTNCKALYYTSGVHKNQDFASCPAGHSERLQWKARGRFAHVVISFNGRDRCVSPVKLFYSGGFTRSQWRIGDTTTGCSVWIKTLTFSN